jgi:hypothetical protein
MYRARFPDQKLTSPIPDAAVRGRIVVDGESIDVTGWRGMQGHNWGVRHTHRYVWCHAGGFDGADDVVFEGFSARVRKGGVELPWLTLGFLWIDGGWLRFDRPAAIAASKADAGIARWRFRTRSQGHVLHGEASAALDQTVGLHYANPRDATTYCLNSKLASLHLVLEGPSGAREFDTTRAALEIGWPSADHGVSMVA